MSDFKAANCPSCGGNLQIPTDKDSVKCMYCGSDIIVQSAIKSQGTDINNTLILADEELNAGNYDKALNYYEKALEIDANNTKALYGKANSLASKYDFVEAIRFFEKLFSFNFEN